MPKVRSTSRRSTTRGGRGQPGRGRGRGSAEHHDTQGEDGQVRPPSPPQDSSDHHDEEELPITADRLLTIIRSEVERLIPDSLRQTPPLVTNSTGRVR